MLTEGVENSAQEVVSSGTKSVYKNIPVFSNEEGTDAWINPKSLKESFITGALAGGIMSGAASIVSTGLNAAVSKRDSEPLNHIDREVRQRLDNGEIDQETADKLVREISVAKAIYSIAESETKIDAKGKIDGYVNDGTFTQKQGESVWQMYTAEAAENGDRKIPTYNIGDIIQFDGEDAKVINIVEEDDGKKYFVDVDGQMDVITEDELTATPLQSESLGLKTIREQSDTSRDEYLDQKKLPSPNIEATAYEDVTDADIDYSRDKFNRQWRYKNKKSDRGWLISERQGNKKYEMQPDAQTILKDREMKENKDQIEPNMDADRVSAAEARKNLVQAVEGIVEALPKKRSKSRDLINDFVSESLKTGRPNKDQIRWFFNDIYSLSKNIDRDNGILQNDVMHDDMFANQDAYQKQLDKFEQQIESAFSDLMGATYHDPARVLTDLPDKKQNGAKGFVQLFYDRMRRKWVDSFASVDDFAKKIKDASLYDAANVTRKSLRKGEQSIVGDVQRDINGKDVGESLQNIFNPLFDPDKEVETQNLHDFYSYLMHYQNVDTPGVIFGKEVTAQDSKNAIAELDKKYPDFYTIAEKVWKFNDNNLQLALDSGLISYEHAENMRNKNPHYVPARRVIDEDADYGTGRGMFKKRLGSYKDIKPIYEQIVDQTLWLRRESDINLFMIRLYEAANNNSEIAGSMIKSFKPDDGDVFVFDAEKAPTHDDVRHSKIFKFYYNGHAITANVANTSAGSGLAEAVHVMRDNDSTGIFLRGIAEANNISKALITTFDPTFIVRNALRDLPDAMFYSKNMKDFVKKYPEAWKQIAQGGEYWNLYKDSGGLSNSYFEFYNRGVHKQSKIKKGIENIEKISMAVEQAPRLAEFMAEVDRRGGIENVTKEGIDAALFAADEATVNFGRSGVWGKNTNRYIAWFFNPSVQGASRFIRNFGANKETAGSLFKLFYRAAIIGVAPEAIAMLINGAFGGDEDEYWKNIAEAEKDKYYYVPNPLTDTDTDFIKLPKPRGVGQFGNVFRRGIEYAQGDKESFDGYLGLHGSLMQNTGPTNPLQNNVLSTFQQIATNKSWNGTPIVSQELTSQYDPYQQYDETTTSLSRSFANGLKKASAYLPIIPDIDVSPKNIDYVANAYGGVLWDSIAPFMTETASDGLFKNKFTANFSQNSKISEQFYDDYEKLSHKDRDAEDTTERDLNYKYIDSIHAQVSNLSDLKHDIQGDKTLSNEEKMLLIDGINMEIYELQKSYQENKDDMAKYFDGATIENEDGLYEKAIKNVFGKDYDKNEATINVIELLEQEGVSKESIYSYYKKDLKISGKDAAAAESALMDYNIPLSKWYDISKSLPGMSTAEKRNYILDYGLNDEQTVYILENKVLSDSVKSLANEMHVNHDIPAIITYGVYSRYYDIKGVEGRKAAAQDLFENLKNNYAGRLSADQMKYLAEEIDKNGYYTPLDVDYDFASDGLSPAYSKTMAKYLDKAIAEKMTEDEFLYAYSFLGNVKNDAPASSYVAQVNQLNLTAKLKAIILDARYIKNYDASKLTDGGDIEVKGKEYGGEDYSTDVTLKDNKTGKTMADYVPPSARSSGVPGDTTIVSGEYKVTVDDSNVARFKTDKGSTVVTPMDGKIIKATRSKYSGIVVTVKFSDGTTGYYTGLSGRNVNYGDKVAAGQTIGSADTSLTFTYKDENGKPINVKNAFNIMEGSGTLSADENYFPTQTAESYDNFHSGGWGGYGGWGYGGWGWGGSNVLASLIGKKHSSYNRYGYGGWPRYSYTGNENKTKS